MKFIVTTMIVVGIISILSKGFDEIKTQASEQDLRMDRIEQMVRGK